ncbi:hypothetical protein [Agromyces sp. PvR057]|uniref:hypothetical protein n=1 Tax=Agromyces sp. PvR057 TaxID=3156403 RepID=UPI003397E385
MSGTRSDAHDDPGATAEADNDRPTFDLRARGVETVVLVASVVVLRLLGVLLMVASSSGLDSFDAFIPLVAMVVDPNVLVWIALAAAVQFGLRSMGRPGRWALIVLAAPVAVVVVNAVRSIPSLGAAGLGALFGNPVAWIDAGILTLLVALGIAFTAAALGGERRTSSRIAGVLLALGGLLTLLLVWQWIAANLVIWASRPTPTPEQENLFLVTAAVTLGALVGAIVFAALSRRRGLIVASCIVGCLGLVITLAVPVPTDRFAPEPPPAPTEPAEPGGGHSCMSPGDPNCVGG